MARGPSLLRRSSAQTTLGVGKVATAISINVSPSSFPYGTPTTVTISGQLTRLDTGVGLSGKTVTLGWPTGSKDVATGSNGYYTYPMTVTITKGWVFRADFPGDSAYLPSSNSVAAGGIESVEITSLVTDRADYYAGSPVAISVTVKNTGDIALSGFSVNVDIASPSGVNVKEGLFQDGISLAVNEEKTLSNPAYWTMPSAPDPGVYTVTAGVHGEAIGLPYTERKAYFQCGKVFTAPYSTFSKGAYKVQQDGIQNMDAVASVGAPGDGSAVTRVAAAFLGRGKASACFVFADRWVAQSSGQYEVTWRMGISAEAEVRRWEFGLGLLGELLQGKAAASDRAYVVGLVVEKDTGKVFKVETPLASAVVPDDGLAREIVEDIVGDDVQKGLFQALKDFGGTAYEDFAGYLGDAIDVIDVASSAAELLVGSKDECNEDPMDLKANVDLVAGKEYMWLVCFYSSSSAGAAGAGATAGGYARVDATLQSVVVQPIGTDSMPPNIQLTGVPPQVGAPSNVTLSWRGSDDQTPPAELAFSYRLLGVDSDWSQWGSSTSKSYANLPAGSYAFSVRGKDKAGNESATAKAYFSVAEPLGVQLTASPEAGRTDTDFVFKVVPTGGLGPFKVYLRDRDGADLGSADLEQDGLPPFLYQSE